MVMLCTCAMYSEQQETHVPNGYHNHKEVLQHFQMMLQTKRHEEVS